MLSRWATISICTSLKEPSWREFCMEVSTTSGDRIGNLSRKSAVFHGVLNC